MAPRYLPVFVLALSCLAASGVRADTAAAEKSGWSGTAGVGPMVFPSYSGGKGMQVWPLPLVSATYNDVVYVEPLRAGAYFAGSADKKMALGLAIEPRMGQHASDGAKLAGMSTRRNSLEGGLALDWDLDVVAISLSYFTDLTRSSKGSSARLYVVKELVKNDTWKFGAVVGADHLSARVANYFFGVTAAEATADRPFYQPGATTNAVYGFDGSYKLNPRYSIVFGVQATRLLGGAGNSPIVETRQANVGWLGFAWNL